MPIHDLLPGKARYAIAVLLGAFMTVHAGGEPTARPVVLEVIVKFSAASDLGRQVSRMLQANTVDMSRFDEPLRELEASLRIPLEPAGITSGREIILRVREAEALERVKEACTNDPNVAHAEVRELQAGNPMLASHRLLVDFADSSREARLVREAARDDDKRDELRALAEKLAAPSTIPVHADAESGDRLGIILDRSSLLESLVERLKGMAQVEYVQANTLLQPMQ